MRTYISLLTFLSILSAPAVVFAASHSGMEKECKTIAQAMMEDPATFKFIEANPTSKDGNKGVAIGYSGTVENFKATLSCFYAGQKLSKLHLQATLEDGEKVNDYLADALVDQVKESIK